MMDPLAFYMLPILALVVVPVPVAILLRLAAAASRTLRNFRIVAALALCPTLGFCAAWQDGSFPGATVFSYPF